MRNLKKVLALVLALMMAVSLMVTANAAIGFDDADEIDPKYREAVEVLEKLGIIVGSGDDDKAAADDETDTEATLNEFMPKETLTRAQFAVFLFKLRTGENPDNEKYAKYAENNVFSDVDINSPMHGYAIEAINYLNDVDAMHGVGDDKFAPDLEVDGYQVVQGLLQAIGYGKLGEFGDNYSEAKLQTAVMGAQKGITTGLGLTLSKKVTREEMAALVFNALTQEEAYVVTLKADGKDYVEEELNFQNRVTLGEANWELHLYGVTSGKTYPSDRVIDKELKLDEFGRPTNPKWVAVVNGEVVKIGEENKAIETYFQRDKITRSDLENEFYSLFAFKDLEANIEYYVDGVKINTAADPDAPWELAYDKDGNRVKGNDKIGGTGVTVELYLMADEKVAVTEDIVAERLWKDYGSTEIGNAPRAWPKMRVVIVHHYAALIDNRMFIKGTDFTDDGKEYKSPDRLELPYDKFDSWNTAHTEPILKPAKVILPLDQADDTYKTNDVIYFSVAISEDEKYTVCDDVNLSNTEGCKVTAPVAFAAPDCTYIRLTDKDQPADYFTYFMQTTTTYAYRANSTHVKAAVGKTMDVYFDPSMEFVALINFGETAAQHPAQPSGYYYIEDIEIVARSTTTANGVKYTLAFVADAVDAKTGDRVSLTLRHALAAGAVEPTEDNPVWHIGKIGDLTVDIKIDAETGKIIPAAGGASAAMIRAESETTDVTYGLVNDTEVYVIEDDVVIYLNGDLYRRDTFNPMAMVKVDEKATDGETAKEPEFVHDKNGNLVFFILTGGQAYVLDLYHTTPLEGPQSAARTMASGSSVTVTDMSQFPVNCAYNAYSTLEALQKVSKEAYTGVEGLPEKFETITVENAYKPISAPGETEPEEPTTDTPHDLDDLLYQFVYTDGTYTLGEDKGAFDVDSDPGYKVVTGILHKNETSSKVTVGDTDYYVDGETTVYSFDGTKVYSDPKTETGLIGYKNVDKVGTYKYWEFEQFGADDDCYVLVVLVKVGNDLRVSYISVISEDADDWNTANVFYGIYCGLDERGVENLVYFVNPNSAKIQGAPLADNVYYELLLEHEVGDVLKFTTTDGVVSEVEDFASKETTVDHNANYFVTEDNVYNLYAPKYYYVGSGYITVADASYVTPGTTVSVYQNASANGKEACTVVVIYSEEFLESLKDGKPYSGQIELEWVDKNT